MCSAKAGLRTPRVRRPPIHGAARVYAAPAASGNARAQSKLLHTWIKLVIVKQYLVQIRRVDGPISSYHKYKAGLRAPRLRRPPIHGAARVYAAPVTWPLDGPQHS